MMKVVIGEVSFWISMLIFFLNLKPTLPAASLRNYNVHSKPVYFLNELEDVVYFRGSTIELHCYASCEQGCISRNKIYHNGSPELGFHDSYDNNTMLTIKINNASVEDSGFYQCLRPVWPWTKRPYIAQIAGRKIHVQITDLGPAEHKAKFISNGDSILLPCAVNTSNKIYPVPDSIEWRKDDGQLENGEDSFITQDKSLLITNLTTNVSYHCVVHWKVPALDYNGSYYQLVINQPAAYHATVYPEGVKAKVGERTQFICVVNGFGQNYTIKWYNNNSPDNALVTINHSHVLDIPLVQLNDSGSYYCVIKNEFASFVSNNSTLQVIEPPHIINISSDVLINTSVINNVILYCSFTNDLTHTTVYWMKGNWNLTDSTDVINNTAILNLSIDANTEDFLGSYQCVVTNAAGYVSRTTRVLPKGWTSAPRNVKAIIEYYSIDNCSINVSWDPPVYNGGLPIPCYKVEVSYGGSNNLLLGDCLTTTSYSWDGCQFISEDDTIKFKITVVDEYKNERSKVENKKLTLPEILLHLMVDCTSNDVITDWKLTSYPYNIDEYCLKYWCGSVNKETCYMDRATSNASIRGVPVHNTTCGFVVIAKGAEIAELNSNNVLCRSPVAPNIILSEEAKQVTEGDIITCTATGYPVPDIVWWDNDGSVVDENRLVTNIIMTTAMDDVSNVSVSMIVRRSDGGIYTCFANNSVGNDTSIINIVSVQSLPIVTIPENYTVTESSNITCTATGYPVPGIVWLNNDGSVVDKNRIITDRAIATGVGNLSSVSVSMTIGRNDAGTYTCVASNSIGNDTHTINVTVYSIPIITIPGNEQSYTLFEDDTITCTATGYPIPDIVWMNNDGSNNRLVTSSPMATDNGSIPSVSISVVIRRCDTGVYKCVANNSVGSDTHTINITVQLAPIISIQKTDEAFVVNEDDSITCTATGYPVPYIVWLNNDESVVDKSRLIPGSIIATGVGNIFNVSASIIVRRSDTGVYTCFANNSVGFDNRTISITVQSVPILNITGSEQLHRVTEQIYVVTGGDNITCTATGYPVPDIVWLNNDRSVVDENRLILSGAMATGVGNLFNRSLLLMIRRSDNGVYMCLGNNSVGINMINITVKPNPEWTENTSYVYFWLLTLLVVTVILFVIALFIIKGRMRRISYEPPPGILDTKIADFDEFIMDTPSRIEVFIGDNESDCSSIKECDVENSKMLEEILYKGDSVVTAISLTSIVDSNFMDNNTVNRESSSHYYDSSSSSGNSSGNSSSNNSNCSTNTGNSVQTQQHYDSGNPIVDNDSINNDGSAYNDR